MMDYSELARYEIIRLMLDNNPANRSPKMVANYFELALSTVLKWGEDPDGSGADMPAKYEIPLMIYCQDYRLAEWMAQQVGLRTVSIRVPTTDGKISDEFFDLGILQGNLNDVVKSIIDKEFIGKRERIDLRANLIRIIKTCEQFISELDNKEVTFNGQK